MEQAEQSTVVQASQNDKPQENTPAPVKTHVDLEKRIRDYLAYENITAYDDDVIPYLLTFQECYREKIENETIKFAKQLNLKVPTKGCVEEAQRYLCMKYCSVKRKYEKKQPQGTVKLARDGNGVRLPGPEAILSGKVSTIE